MAEGSGGQLLAIDAEGNLLEGGWGQLAAAKTFGERIQAATAMLVG